MTSGLFAAIGTPGTGIASVSEHMWRAHGGERRTLLVVRDTVPAFALPREVVSGTDEDSGEQVTGRVLAHLAARRFLVEPATIPAAEEATRA